MMKVVDEEGGMEDQIVISRVENTGANPPVL